MRDLGLEVLLDLGIIYVDDQQEKNVGSCSSLYFVGLGFAIVVYDY